MTASDYPVTTPYGFVPGYPLHGGFHQGIDYGCPIGTPVSVNNIIIGLSGNTGYTFGPHLHVGRWVNGAPTPPSDGFSFSSAVVSEIDDIGNTDNGKFVRLQADGASWVYLHLSQINVLLGQTLKGNTMGKPSRDEVIAYFKGFAVQGASGVVGQPTEDQISYYSARTYDVILNDILNDVWNRLNQCQAAGSGTFTAYSGAQLFVKK